MFELERSLEQWRRSLAALPGLTADAVAELESHLRDEIQRQQEAGCEPEQAFARAVDKLGTPQALAREFTKVAPETTAPWWPMRIVIGVTAALALLLIERLTASCLEGRFGVLLAVHIGAVTIGYSLSFVAGVLALCYVVQGTLRDLRPEQKRGLARGLYYLTGTSALTTGLGVLLGSVWAQEHLGRWWGWDAKETGAALVLAWDVLMVLFLRRRAGKEEEAVLLGLVGSVLVCLAWFGANDVAGTHRFILLLVILAHAAVYLVGRAQTRHVTGRWV
jgi:Cytochrome C assembly protein